MRDVIVKKVSLMMMIMKEEEKIVYGFATIFRKKIS